MLEFHPLAELFPMMSDAEIGELSADIKAHGLQEPVSIYEGKILDGRNRWAACDIAGIKPASIEWHPKNGETAINFVVSKNLHRRNLTTSQRAMVATRLSALSQGEKRADSDKSLSQSDAAEALNVGVDVVKRARKVTEQAAPEVAAAVSAGTVSVSDAAAVADAPKAEQRKALKNVEAGKAKTLKQQIKPKKKNVLCSRCARVGVVKDCEACMLMRKVKSGKATIAEQTAVLPDEEPADETIEDQIKAKNSELEGWCRDLMAFGATMPDDPWLQDLNKRKGAMQKLENCCETIRSAKCHCRCPKCNGDGCRQCHKTGRVTLYANQQLS